VTSSPDLTPLSDEVARAQAAASSAPRSGPAGPPGEREHIEIPLSSGKARKRKTEKDDDLDSVRRAHKRGGEKMAYSVGRAMNLSDDEIAAAIAPPPPPRASAPREERAGAKSGSPRSSRSGGRETTPEGDIVIETGDGERWIIPAQNVKPLPDNCPVTPLGKQNGEFYYLDPLNQLRAYDASDHSAQGIRDLFGTQVNYLYQNWPKFSAQTRKCTGFKADATAESLMVACASRGIFDAAERLRGVGAWLDDNGGLVLHMGDKILFGGEAKPPGEYGGRLYPAYAATAGVADSDHGATELFDGLLGLFDSWNWAEYGREEEGQKILEHSWQSWLVFGWMGTAIIGGALAYRPPLWLTADAGAGKSAFLDVVQQVIGDVVKSANATQAYIWSTLGQSTRPVLIDEAEANPHSLRTKNLVELARQAFSGDKIGRGSSDHKAHDFEARSSFLFSSIIIPPFAGQDVSRFAILDMAPIEKGGDLTLDAGKNREIGCVMRRRIVNRWSEWPKMLTAWRATLSGQGHNSRDADVFGPMLAMADLLFNGELSRDSAREEICRVFPVTARARTSNAQDMLELLLSKPLDVFRGGDRHTVEQLILTATYNAGAGSLPEGSANPDSCEKALRPFGIFLENEGMQQWRVILPNRNEGLRMLFHGSTWGTEPGSTGGWAQAMKRLPERKEVNSRKFGGRGWSVPVKVFLMREE
jgi:hypothetical protein